MPKLVIRDLATMQIYKGSYAPSNVDFAFGELAIDVIGHATAEDLLKALKPLLNEDKARAIVGLLLEGQLTFDSVIDGEVR